MDGDRVALGGGRRRGALSGRTGWLLVGLGCVGLIAALLHALWGPLGLRQLIAASDSPAATFPRVFEPPAAAQRGIPSAIACASAGNCVAVVRDEAFGAFFVTANVATETRGRWGAVRAISLPAGAKGSGQITQLTSVSCPAIRECVAVGQYLDSRTSFQGMYVAESQGVWRRAGALELPANANPTVGDEAADLTSVSCPSPGNCAAVGHYGASTTPSLAMATTETRGVWGRAVQIKPPAGANTTLGHEIAELGSVTCISSGDCVATGQYNDSHDDAQPMVVTETHGRWARAIRIDLPAQATTAQVGLGSVACASRGNCVALGTFQAAYGDQGITVTETRGRWARATVLSAPRGAGWLLKSVSCRAGSCVAAGGYDTATGTYPIVTRESNGKWTAPLALQLPNTAASKIANNGQNAFFAAISCTNHETCTAVGQYEVPFGPRTLGYAYRAAMTAVETHGHWSKPTPVTLSQSTSNTTRQ